MNLPHLVFLYGMKERGFSPGCQPRDGFIERIDDVFNEFYDILIYNRKLTKEELEEYELSYITERWYKGDPE